MVGGFERLAYILYFLKDLITYSRNDFNDVLQNRLSLENFTGKTALAIRQDFHATIFLTNYEAMLIYDSNLELLDKTKDNNYAQKVNKKEIREESKDIG